MGKMTYNEKGEEICDPTKTEVPLGFRKPPSLADQVRAMVRSEAIRQEALKNNRESFDEADDFDVGDDYDPRSPYEEIFEPTEDPAVEKIIKARRAKVAEQLKSAEEGVERETPKAKKSPRKQKASEDRGGSGGEPPPEAE